VLFTMNIIMTVHQQPSPVIRLANLPISQSPNLPITE
jgi:hypothetical protein